VITWKKLLCGISFNNKVIIFNERHHYKTKKSNAAGTVCRPVLPARHVCIFAFLALSARGSVRNQPESVEEKFHLARHLTIGKTLLPDKNPRKTKQNNKQKEKGDGTSTVSL